MLPKVDVTRQGDAGPVQRIIVAAVLEFLADASAHFEPMIFRHSYIASVKQAVDVSTHQYPVRCGMLATFGIRPDMRCLQRWHRPLASYRASSVVEIGNQQAEHSLPEPSA